MQTNSIIRGQFFSYSAAIEFLKSKAGLRKRHYETGMFSIQPTGQAPLSWVLILYGNFYTSEK